MADFIDLPWPQTTTLVPSSSFYTGDKPSGVFAVLSFLPSALLESTAGIFLSILSLPLFFTLIFIVGVNINIECFITRSIPPSLSPSHTHTHTYTQQSFLQSGLLCRDANGRERNDFYPFYPATWSCVPSWAVSYV